MASQGPNSPSTGANDASVGTPAWSNPGNVTAADGSNATASAPGAATSQYLKATGFGFTVPGGSSVDGILVEWKRFQSGGTVTDFSAKIVKGGSVVGDEKAAGGSWPGSAAYASYGGAADTWGVGWAASDVNDSTFGAVLSASVNLSTANVDHCQVTVYYTPPAGGPRQQTAWGRVDPHPGFWDQ